MKRLLATIILLTGMWVILIALFAKQGNSLPIFARKHQVSCSSCHTAWPALNASGRSFKENGYRFDREEEPETVISDSLQWDKGFPIGAHLKARPYDKKDSGDEKLRAIHEVEVLVAGTLYKNVSGWFEAEAEDEDDFEPFIAEASIGYHHSDAINLQFIWGPLHDWDPYDTYNSRLLTRGGPAVIDQSFGGADNNEGLGTRRQMVALYGRPWERLFYSLGRSGVASDAEGVNPNNFHGRLAFEFSPNIMAGLFGVEGEWEDPATRDREFSRYGIDAQAEFALSPGPLLGDLRLQGVYLVAEDERATSGKEDNDAWYAQAWYAVRSEGRPTWVPLVRFDSYERNDGEEDFQELTLNLGYYFTENIKGFVEYWNQLDVPSGVQDDSRLSLQLEVAF